MTAQEFKQHWGISVAAYPFHRFHLRRTLGDDTVRRMDKQAEAARRYMPAQRVFENKSAKEAV